MDPDLSKLDARLDELDADGYLLDADSTDANQYYVSGFDAPDPFLTLYDGSVHLLFVRSLEFGRAKRESRGESVERFTDYGYDDRLEAYDRQEAAYRTRAAFLDAYDIDTVAVPPRFPLQTADGLRPFNLRSVPLDSAAGSVEGYAIYTDLTSSEPTDRSVLQDSPAEPISGRPVAEEHRGQHRRESMGDHQNEDRDEPGT